METNDLLSEIKMYPGILYLTNILVKGWDKYMGEEKTTIS